jgi:hypothetical protein
MDELRFEGKSVIAAGGGRGFELIAEELECFGVKRDPQVQADHLRAERWGDFSNL